MSEAKRGQRTTWHVSRSRQYSWRLHLEEGSRISEVVVNPAGSWALSSELRAAKPGCVTRWSWLVGAVTERCCYLWTDHLGTVLPSGSSNTYQQFHTYMSYILLLLPYTLSSISTTTFARHFLYWICNEYTRRPLIRWNEFHSKCRYDEFLMLSFRSYPLTQSARCYSFLSFSATYK